MGETEPVQTVNLRGIAVGRATLDEWVRGLASAVGVRRDRAHHHVSLNAAKWIALRTDPELRTAVRSADTVAADGIGIVGLSHWIGEPLPERAPGVDIARGLLHRGAPLGWRVALCGARPAVVGTVATRLAEQGIDVVLAHDGYEGCDASRADRIAAVRPDLVLVALGTPRAEAFVARYAARWPGAVAMGVGGAFDVWAGVVPRAPAWARRHGLEWAARFARQPRQRFGRAIVDSLRFVAATTLGAEVPP